MNEQSFCHTLIEQMKQVVKENDVKRVFSVEVELGTESGIEPGQLVYAYPAATKGTLFEETELILSETDGDSFRMVNMEVE